MIGQIITDPTTGMPVNGSGKKLSVSQYQPPADVKTLFARVQQDYQVAWALQHKPLDEFDGYSLLQRTRMDQQTFGAFVGAEYVPAHKRWMWKGRKNTARNKIIGILAHLIAGMLYPFVSAKNEDSDEDKQVARVMRILVEDHLKKAKYEVKFLFMALSALVNPAVFVGVEYVEAIQLIKKKVAEGKYQVVEAVDELLSGINLYTIPIDEVLLGDLYSGTGSIQNLPVVFRVRRIAYDQARAEFANKFVFDGKDLFDFVTAGQTRIFASGQEGQTLYDIEATEADPGFVQIITAYYRSEDLEVTWVGGVGMFNYNDPYNSNPFKKRRMCLVKGEWLTIPITPIAMSGFEPIDPSGRFAYYKSAAFKEYWDALGQDKMHQVAYNAAFLDAIKPTFISGSAKVDGIVMAPGAVIGLPANASVNAYSMGPNIPAVINMMNKQEQDMSESTQDKLSSGNAQPGVTATATNKAEQNARVILGLFGLMIADLVKQVGELVMDDIVAHTTIGEIDASVPESLKRKFTTYLAKSKDRGRDISNKIIFTDSMAKSQMTKEQVDAKEWDIYNSVSEDPAIRDSTDQRIFYVDPYRFARYVYSMTVDSDQIIMKGMGTERQRKILSFQMMTDPRVMPFTDQKAVIDDFVIEEFGGNDPERYKKKDQGGADMLNSVMGQPGAPAGQAGGVGPVVPTQTAPVQTQTLQ